jgi:hypothetical protein
MKLETVEFESGDIRVTFDTGETLNVPLDFFPELAAASPKQRAGWTLIGRGIGIHWEALDVDISVENFLAAHSRARRVHYA